MRMPRTHSTKAAGAYAQHGGPGARLRPGQRRRAATHTRTRSRASHADVPACGKSARVLAARHGMCRGAACAGCGLRSHGCYGTPCWHGGPCAHPRQRWVAATIWCRCPPTGWHGDAKRMPHHSSSHPHACNPHRLAARECGAQTAATRTPLAVGACHTHTNRHCRATHSARCLRRHRGVRAVAHACRTIMGHTPSGEAVMKHTRWQHGRAYCQHLPHR